MSLSGSSYLSHLLTTNIRTYETFGINYENNLRHVHNVLSAYFHKLSNITYENTL